MYQKFPAFIHSLKRSKNSSCSQLSQGTGHLIFLTKYKKHENEQLSDFSRFFFASTDVNELNKHLRTQKTKFLVTTKREHGGKFYQRNRGQNDKTPTSQPHIEEAFVSPIDAESLELAKTLLAQPTTRSTEAQFPSNQREEGHLTQNIINDYIRPRILPLGW